MSWSSYKKIPIPMEEQEPDPGARKVGAMHSRTSGFFLHENKPKKIPGFYSSNMILKLHLTHPPVPPVGSRDSGLHPLTLNTSGQLQVFVRLLRSRRDGNDAELRRFVSHRNVFKELAVFPR